MLSKLPKLHFLDRHEFLRHQGLLMVRTHCIEPSICRYHFEALVDQLEILLLNARHALS
jgi:hypothetical protein